MLGAYRVLLNISSLNDSLLFQLMAAISIGELREDIMEGDFLTMTHQDLDLKRDAVEGSNKSKFKHDILVEKYE